MTEGMLHEVGFWVIAGLVAIGIINLLGTFVGRRTVSRFHGLAKDLLADPKCNRFDRAWINQTIKDAQGHNIWQIAVVIPGLAVLIPFALASEVSDLWKTDKDVAVKELERKIEFSARKSMELLTGEDLGEAALWTDPRRKEFESLSTTVEMSAFPVLSVWIAFWFIPTAIFAGIFSVVLQAAGHSAKTLVGILLREAHSSRGTLLIR